MGRLLRDNDYLRLIQSDNLSQIIESNQQVRLDVEQSAQAEMKSYLAQRYKTDEVFRNTYSFAITEIYKAKTLVEYTEDAFDATADYQQGNRVLQGGVIYEANEDIPHAAFDADDWTEICDDKTLFYVTLPESEYDSETTYAVGTKLWHKDKVYTNARACKNIDPTNSDFWGTGVDYSVTGQYPDNADFWTEGDNRNQQIVMYLIDIALFHLHSRINPRNVPDLRKERYNGNSPSETGGALGWLKMVAGGKVNADLPEISPEQGLPMRHGSASSFDYPSANQMW